MESTKKYVQLFSELGIEGPYLLSVSILGVREYTLFIPFQYFFDQYQFNNEYISLPNISINDITDELPIVLKPMFDVLWNSFGIYESLNYINGEWDSKNH